MGKTKEFFSDALYYNMTFVYIKWC